jgi:hypothetical protein
MTKTRDLADLGGGFIQAGSGAVQRTVESKLQDVVSVKDFGAVGDGVADDTAAIQAALTATYAVYFPAGNYRINGSITLREGNSLQGPSNSNSNTDTNLNNGSVKLIFYGVGDSCFKAGVTTSIGRLGFSGITIMAHDNPGRPWVFDLPSLNESNFFCVSAWNASVTGGVFRVSLGSNPVSWVNYFTNCEFGLPDASNQYVVDAIFTDTRIVGSYFTGGKGFYYHGYGGTLFSSCHFDRTNSAGAGLVLGKRETGHSPTHQTLIVGCYFDENDAAGIILDSTNATANTQWQATVVGCGFRNRVTATDIKCLSAAGNDSFGGTFVGCSMSAGIPGFSFGARWYRPVVSGITVPGADPFIYKSFQIIPGFANEVGGSPTLTWRNSGLTDGSPNTLAVGIDGAALNGAAYVNTGKAGVANNTPFQVRINGSTKTIVDDAGDLALVSGRLKVSSSITQSTVGVAGAASTLPTNPTGYFKVVVNGVEKVVPYYES